jgi:tellurite resistance protein TerC
MPTEAKQSDGKGPAPSRAGDAAVALACLGLALAFGAAVWLRRGPEAGQQYLAGYLIELGLSVDNAFVFALVFEYFGLDPRRQRRLLFLGVAGALVLRTLFITAGLGAIARFAWIVPLFGALILATGIRLAASGPGRKSLDPSGPIFRMATRHAPAGLAALFVLESADLVFAMDSLPAVMAVTHDPMVAIASNLFAILGLRSLFFVVSGAMRNLRYLHRGLAAVLSFVGVKMLAEPWYTIPAGASLAAIAALLGASVAASLLSKRPGAG